MYEYLLNSQNLSDFASKTYNYISTSNRSTFDEDRLLRYLFPSQNKINSLYRLKIFLFIFEQTFYRKFVDPTLKQLAKAGGCSLKTAWNTRKELAEIGVFVVHNRVYASNVYIPVKKLFEQSTLKKLGKRIKCFALLSAFTFLLSAKPVDKGFYQHNNSNSRTINIASVVYCPSDKNQERESAWRWLFEGPPTHSLGDPPSSGELPYDFGVNTGPRRKTGTSGHEPSMVNFPETVNTQSSEGHTMHKQKSIIHDTENHHVDTCGGCEVLDEIFGGPSVHTPLTVEDAIKRCIGGSMSDSEVKRQWFNNLTVKEKASLMFKYPLFAAKIDSNRREMWLKMAREGGVPPVASQY